MKITKLTSVLLVSAFCLSTITACSKSDQAADDLAYMRKQKEKEVTDKSKAERDFEIEQARLREYFKKHPLP